MALLLTEVLARFILPDFADETTYLNRAFARLLNSVVVFDRNNATFSRKYGFAFSPNSTFTERTAEFTYTTRTNSLGFRTKELQPKRDNEYRVLLLGDSMFWGVGVEERDMVSSVMETLGKSSVGDHLSVYNYAVNGSNTVQQLIIANSHLEAVRPDRVVLGFFIANDILPNSIARIDAEGNYDTSLEAELRLRRELRARFGVLFNSIIFRVIALQLYVPKVRYQIASTSDVIAKSYVLLTELDNLTMSRGSRLSVAVLYPRDSVQGGTMAWWTKSRETGRMIHSFCRQQSIEVLDLLDYMNNEEHRRRYFFEHDGHPNKEGNVVIATAIFNDLVKPHMTR